MSGPDVDSSKLFPEQTRELMFKLARGRLSVTRKDELSAQLLSTDWESWQLQKGRLDGEMVLNGCFGIDFDTAIGSGRECRVYPRKMELSQNTN